MHLHSNFIFGLFLSLQENEVQLLLQRLENFQSGNIAVSGDVEPDSELGKLEAENFKLKYRLNILKRAVEAMSNVQGNGADRHCDGMLNIQESLEKLFTQAVRKSFPDLPEFPISVVPTIPKFGDYQFNGAMEISKV